MYKKLEDEFKAEFKHEIKSFDNVNILRLLPAILSRKECNDLLNAYPETTKKNKRNRLVIRLLYSTGIRIAELSNLKYCDLNFDDNTIFIRSGKGDKDRYVCCDVETMKILKEKLKNFQLSDNIFKVSIRQLRRIVEKAGTITGISEKYEAMNRVFSAHSLRHAFATHCYENGMRIFTLKKLLGHQYLGTTEIYISTAARYDVLEYLRSGVFRG